MVTRIARFVSNGLIAVLVASKNEVGKSHTKYL